MGSTPSLILLLAGVGFIGFGAAYALWPARMAGLTDLTLTSPTARADFIATYGGFQIGFGLFLLACVLETSWLVPGLWAVTFALGGFASLRALTIVRHRGGVRRTIWFGLGLELLGLALSLWALSQLRALTLLASERPAPGTPAACQVYRPHLAKRTYDGRVGSVLLHNTSPRDVVVKVYHPDGVGDVELERHVAAGSLLVLEGENGGRLALGNDWGIQVDESCVATLGQAAVWTSGEFSLRWDGGSLRPGVDARP